MDVETFISSVFVKNPLWDQKDVQHHNRFVLDKLWDAVADEMKTTRSIVRTKWKNLRDTFRKELRKMPVKRSGDEASSWKSSWQYFDSLYFLKDQFTARESTGNLPDSEQENILDDDRDSQLSEPNTLNMDHGQNTNSEPAASTPIAKKLKRKHQSDADVGNTLIKLEEQKIRIMENQQKKSPDEDESFFDSLLPHIRKLTPEKKMLLRIKMQELVYNFVYKDQLSNQPYCGSQSTSRTEKMHAYEVNSPQYMELTPVNTYSNPTSVRSYLTNYSEESVDDV